MAQQEVFYEVLSGTKKLPVYDVDAHNKLASARTDLDALSGKVDTHIADTDRHVTAEDKAKWDKVTEKVDTSAFDEYKTSAETELGKKLDKDTFNTFTATADVTPYVPGANIDITNHVVSGKYWTTEINDAKSEASAAALADAKAYTDDKDAATRAWANETFQPVGPYATSAYVDEAVDTLADNIEAQFGDLHNTTVKAGYGIRVTSAADPVTEDVEYTVETDPSVLNYGLFNTYQTITYVSPSTVLGFETNGDIQGENISLDTTTHQISLEPGSYHIDIQVNANIDGSNCALTNAYYDGILTANPQPIRTVRMSIDGSYVHAETFTLSYDIKIEETTILTFTMSGLPSGCQCSATLNIHEILTLEGAAEAISNNYTAGDGMRLENKSFSVNQGDGLEITSDNKLQVKLGSGLAFTEDYGIQAISIDPEGDVAEVVETVKELENAIATKITTNYPPAMITDSHAQVMGGTQYTPGNGGCLYGTLFNTPITHPVAIDKTFLGIYAYNGGVKAILGIYEYQPDYERKDGTGAVTGFGRTVPLCDTGIVTISQGFHEYPIKHLNNTIGGTNPETTPELKTNCMYYATLYLGYASTAGSNDLQVGCAAGYSPQYGNIKPAMSMANVNNIKANIDVPGHAAYTEDLSFNDMGFNWQYDSYPERGSDSSSTYFEANASPRMYMQIRNIK